MCGILGYFAKDYHLERFQEALCLLNHRGPFGQGAVALANGALGMTRLPMSGSKPIAVPPQVMHYTAAYNGEVYAHASEIKEEISRLIKGLEKDSPPDGMYAIAYWDDTTRNLVLYRDTFGIKPLYYAYDSATRRLAFSSELKPLLHLLGRATLNHDAIAQIVAAGVPLDHQTLLNEVRLLRPGEKLTFHLTGQGFELRETRHIAISFEDTPDSLESRIDASLKQCCNTFRPSALLISGGVDSNLLNSFMAPQTGKFNLAIEHFDELELKHENLHRILMKESTFMATLRRSVANFGSATRMTSLVMYQELSDAIAEQGYHSVIVGEGADEMFWGYARHVDLWARKDDLDTGAFASAWFGDFREKSQVLGDSDSRHVCQAIEDRASEALADGVESAVTRFDLDYSLEPLLRRSDHILMAHTIEARTPFLHGGLPGATPYGLRIANGHGKAVLYELLAKRVPQWRDRPKKHFRIPLSAWGSAQADMKSHLRQRMDFLGDIGIRSISPQVIDSADANQLFTLTTLSLWGQEYGAYL